MCDSLPYSTKDLHYDNAKFRQRSFFQVLNRIMYSSNSNRKCAQCSMGKFLLMLLIFGVGYLILVHAGHPDVGINRINHTVLSKGSNATGDSGNRLMKFWRKPPRLSPDEITQSNRLLMLNENEASKWISRQQQVKEAFIHAWSGYTKYAMGFDELMPLSKRGVDGLGGLGATVVDALDTAMIMGADNVVSEAGQQQVKEAFIHAWSGYAKYAMGFDELMPLSKRGVDGLGGLGATVVDALDTAMIMGADNVVSEAGSWIEANLVQRIKQKGQVNLFETTIRVVGGLLSAYHLSSSGGIHKSPQPTVYLDAARTLADLLLSAFTSSPTPIPFSDVVLRENSSHPAPDGLSTTSEVSTLQMEFNYLSVVTGDPKYSFHAMKVLEHIKTLPKVEGLVPIYISPHTGEFSGQNIRLGSRGDSYYEYLLKVWLLKGTSGRSNVSYLYDMYHEAMMGVKHLLIRKSIPKGLVFVGELPSGPKGSFSSKMDHLVCFLPGVLALGATKGIAKARAMKDNLLTFEDMENLKLAEDLAKTCVEMYSVTSTGLAPEIAYFHVEDYFEPGLDGGNKTSEYVDDIIIKPLDRHNLLRPETVESLFVLYRITEDPKYREWGWQIFEAFEKYTKVDSGGYTSLDDVTVLPPRRRDKMETFFLGETLKYLYLLFSDTTVIPLDKYVFNTEAHPFPISDSSCQLLSALYMGCHSCS
ncbi:Mannosyl-oligosaccharide 1,2-alpha-mannosidase MNS3-like protein [Drosera capensis]